MQVIYMVMKYLNFFQLANSDGLILKTLTLVNTDKKKKKVQMVVL